MQEGSVQARKALIVHPLFHHTLEQPPVAYRFQTLPQELIYQICSHFDDPKDLCNFRAINKDCRQTASDDLLWRDLCKLHYNVPDHGSPKSWRDLYRYNFGLFKDLFLKTYLEQIGNLAGRVQLNSLAFQL